MGEARSGAEEDSKREQIALREIRDAIRSVRYGTVTAIVQDGLVIQIDRVEKVRIDYSRPLAHRDGDGI